MFWILKHLQGIINIKFCSKVRDFYDVYNLTRPIKIAQSQRHFRSIYNKHFGELAIINIKFCSKVRDFYDVYNLTRPIKIAQSRRHLRSIYNKHFGELGKR